MLEVKQQALCTESIVYVIIFIFKKGREEDNGKVFKTSGSVFLTFSLFQYKSNQ